MPQSRGFLARGSCWVLLSQVGSAVLLHHNGNGTHLDTDARGRAPLAAGGGLGRGRAATDVEPRAAPCPSCPGGGEWPKVSALGTAIDPVKCMGDWYVQRGIPASSSLEKDSYNNKENYAWDEKTKRVAVTYTLNSPTTGKLVTTTQIGKVKEDKLGTTWLVKPKLDFIFPYLPVHFPFWLEYLVIDADAECKEHMIVSAPEGALIPWMYIMTRQKAEPDENMEKHMQFVKEKGFHLKKIITFRHDE
mmetsp:Transcript_42112/g.119060  ORF Transcript_42112/g.119060 Transcript_42112/m.119060 type:complete len:247 (+) Transcript_42112:111-851(+)|eukprot:CAMPEP_0179274268 /NCGR_PEP_ID=MMETSP0797-20121207/33440_1 /TAXON_ID=47934 /ORGANISM="Dinophysis acuminata, Strain DAEP01" /LENGTH=246 /DNA_ID=CAMNT_0020982719 /DNA_START=58 /DNA_END=798 /DNA_ORIENTATION=+